MTQLLEAAGTGDRAAGEVLLPLVYDELRRVAANQLAREPAGLTLQPTALVHEAFLKLFGNQDVRWEGRAHFFGAAARAMRQILVDRARRYKAEKHGGGRARRALDSATLAIADPTPTPGNDGSGVDLIGLDAALVSLERRDKRQAEVVLLRYFAGLTVEQTAEALGVSAATVKNDWMFAKAWLRREMERAVV
jgi:RNA polymerase sigma factor (TIGR02999 family)